MKIMFRQTGGFAGLKKSFDVDCDKIPVDEAKFLQSLVDQSGFFDQPEPDRRKVLPDEEQYVIRVEAAGRWRRLPMSRSSVPDNLKPLIEYIAKRAKYEKRK